ncbi:unnamed protein product, partial [Schistosoma mattheei]
MPSEDKKKKAQAKKDAVKKRNQKQTRSVSTVLDNESDVKTDKETNSTSQNGLLSQSSNHNQIRDDDFVGSDDENKEVHQALVETLECLDLVSERVAAYRSVTGVLASHPEARDVQFSNLSITFHGKALLADTRLELNNGRRNATLALPVLAFTSASEPPCSSMMLR